MTISYGLRLLVLSLGIFFLVHLFASSFALFLSRKIVRGDSNRTARESADALLILRLLPTAVAFFCVLCFCIPSYLVLEPRGGSEQVGLKCLVPAILSSFVCLLSILRSARAVLRTRRFLKADDTSNAFAPVVVTGLFRPKVIVSESARALLSPRQLEAVKRHEDAHVRHRDNLKRLLFLLCPDPLPAFRAFRKLEAAWSKYSEWAADDAASSGSEENAVVLAEALLRTARARQTRAPASAALASAFASSGAADLSARVQRLLYLRQMPVSERRLGNWLPQLPVIAAVAASLALLLHASTLEAVHRLLESLIQ
ncbi:MAG: M56 family metallopeptidase [Acidobacteriaceae bacterium]|nr:M56 family metallopeptidase [Acidobacteriaceae bacterium]